MRKANNHFSPPPAHHEFRSVWSANVCSKKSVPWCIVMPFLWVYKSIVIIWFLLCHVKTLKILHGKCAIVCQVLTRYSINICGISNWVILSWLWTWPVSILPQANWVNLTRWEINTMASPQWFPKPGLCISGQLKSWQNYNMSPSFHFYTLGKKDKKSQHTLMGKNKTTLFG